MAVDEAAFVKSLVYVRSAPPSRMFPDVAALRRLDKHYEKVESKWMHAGILLSIASIGAFVWMLATLDSGRVVPKVALGVAVVAMIGAWIQKGRYGNLNTEDRRYELLGGLLKLLQTDMAEDAPLRVRLDLGRPNVKKNFVRKGKAGSWSVKFYQDHWLKIQGRFLDGTAFELVVTELFQERSRWQTSRSGKMKHKTKTKSASEFVLRLKPKTKRYQHLTTIGKNARRAVQLPRIAALKDVTVQDRGLVLKVKCKGRWDDGPKASGTPGSKVVAMMFLSLYQVLNLSRRLTKKAG